MKHHVKFTTEQVLTTIVEVLGYRKCKIIVRAPVQTAPLNSLRTNDSTEVNSTLPVYSRKYGMCVLAAANVFKSIASDGRQRSEQQDN